MCIRDRYETLHAVDYLIQRIHGAPGEITLVPIGPLTNIAAAIRRAPEIAQEVKGITLMGGYFHEDIPEWNIFCDPEAARIVFTSGIPIRAVLSLIHIWFGYFSSSQINWFKSQKASFLAA